MMFKQSSHSGYEPAVFPAARDHTCGLRLYHAVSDGSSLGRACDYLYARLFFSQTVKKPVPDSAAHDIKAVYPESGQRLQGIEHFPVPARQTPEYAPDHLGIVRRSLPGLFPTEGSYGRSHAFGICQSGVVRIYRHVE